ncbi:MAG: J domain-containing protein [Acidobacteria bacterium]|jgi:curved DNA-binding protein|nr:J domain-containing protein [Acidobacteriota bacterium]
MEYKDYYKTLGVSKDASAKEIKAAYRKLARKFHPDVNQGDAKAEARFKEVNEAHEVLGDPEKRKRYDQLGSNWESFSRGGRGAGPWPGGGVRVEYEDLGGRGGGGFSEFFSTFFGGGGGFGGFRGGGFGDAGEVYEPPSHAEGEVTLTLPEVLNGSTREVGINEGGKTRRVEVKIPPGVRHGSRVRVAGAGGKGSRGQRGNLYLNVRIAADPRFERDGDDLKTSVRVPLTTAVLGGEADVETLDGKVGIKIPAGTPVGRVFRLRGQGLPRLGASKARGDLLASLTVDLPATLSEKQRELFEQLRGAGL